MATKKQRAEQFTTRTIPIHVEETSVSEKPFVVAFETSDGYSAGARLTEEEFYRILDYYESVIVHWKEGNHPSQKDHYLLYCDACDIDLKGDDIEKIEKRKRSKEVVGEFRWFYHGKAMPSKISIGLHCLDDRLWKKLP